MPQIFSRAISANLIRLAQIIHSIMARCGFGDCLTVIDEKVLRAATEAKLTLVTYDLKTIPPLLSEWASDNETHAGVIFVDDSSIRNNDFGRLVNALLAHWQKYHEDDWTNRIAFLTASTAG